MSEKVGNILIFGGTTEGRLLAGFCEENRIPACISVATEYGESLLEKGRFVRVLTGRKDEKGIRQLIGERNITLVIDATHPFAVEASRNISSACAAECVGYLRLLRPDAPAYSGTQFDSIAAVVDYLNRREEGHVLLTTGSKELHLYREVNHYSERCAVRVLPADGIVEKCLSLGFRRENIIAQKGPFTVEQNCEHIRRFGAAFLVTKESGSAGGFDAKREAAEACGAELLVIRRPSEQGVSLEEVKRILIGESKNE